MKNEIKYSLIVLAFLLITILIVRTEQLHSSIKTITNTVSAIKKDQELITSVIKTPRNNPVAVNKSYKIDIGDSVVLGNKNAPITLIKWTDYQCPYCARSSSLTTEILNKYPNDVKVVIKNYPLNFHKQAMAAARYSLAAHKQGKFKEMYSKIFANYKGLSTNENLPKLYAEEMGLDMDQFISDYNSTDIQKQINNEMKQLQATGMKISVPKFLINGKEVRGARSLESFSQIIDSELKKIKG